VRELTVTGVRDCAISRGRTPDRAGVDRRRDRIVVEQDRVTGVRLKHYSNTADIAYWTDLWKSAIDVSYVRESRGHLPHQLRGTFRRWVKPGARTLEAGCGLGQFTIAAHALGYRAEGLDWSSETIDILRQRFASIPWHVGDARHLEFPNDTFDAVYSPGVCEHFEEGPAAVLSETRRVLRPGGIAVVSTPCFNVWLQRNIDASERNEFTDANDAGCAGAPFYQYAFTPDGLAALLSRLGFDVVQVRPYAALHTLARYRGWRVPARLKNVVALTMDYVPMIRNWGSTCIWVARKR
jgi:SAM-dependent methyltransferase